MLTIQINDALLEQRILAKALRKGISAQEFVSKLVAETLGNGEESAFPQLDPKKHGKVIQHALTEEEQHLADAIMPFSQVTDPAIYTHDLRRKLR